MAVIGDARLISYRAPKLKQASERAPSFNVALPSRLRVPGPVPAPPSELLVTRFSLSLACATGAPPAFGLGAAAAAESPAVVAGRLPNAFAEGGGAASSSPVDAAVMS